MTSARRSASCSISAGRIPVSLIVSATNFSTAIDVNAMQPGSFDQTQSEWLSASDGM